MGTEEKGGVEQLQVDGDLISLEENEKRHVIRVLKAVDGNRTAAAKILKIDRRSLYRRLDRFIGKDHSTIVPSRQSPKSTGWCDRHSTPQPDNNTPCTCE